MDEKPLPLATYILRPITFTLVGYQPVGINPFDELAAGLLISKTARQLLSALAIYNVFSLALNASPLVVDPFGASGYKAVLKVSITLRSGTLITETELSLAFATKRYLPFFVRQISLGLSPTGIESVIILLPVLNTSSLSPPHNDRYNSFLSGDNRQVYASAVSCIRCNIFFVLRSTIYRLLFSRVTTYNNLFASSMSRPAGEICTGHFSPSLMVSFNTSFLS